MTCSGRKRGLPFVPGALVVLAVAVLLPPTAGAHIEIAPPFVEDGVETTIEFRTPNERPPHVTTRLSVTAPAGIEVVSADAPAGWRATVSGSTVTWAGGRIENRSTLGFPVRIVARVRAGTYGFGATQRYEDGATVQWKADLSVLPATGTAAPKQHPWGAVAAAVGGLLVIVLSVLLLRRFRRPPLQE
jgi:hypothetical protein